MDINDYLHTGRNSLNKEDALHDYLHYRSPDLGEWYANNEEIAPNFDTRYKDLPESAVIGLIDNENNSLFEEWVEEVVTTEKGVEFIMQDMAACNFALEELNEKLIEE